MHVNVENSKPAESPAVAVRGILSRRNSFNASWSLLFGVMACFGLFKSGCCLCAGSTLLLPSPAKPVMLPVSVMGQNAMGPVQMVSSQVRS